MLYTRKCIGGSNPPLSASQPRAVEFVPYFRTESMTLDWKESLLQNPRTILGGWH